MLRITEIGFTNLLETHLTTQCASLVALGPNQGPNYPFNVSGHQILELLWGVAFRHHVSSKTMNDVLHN